MPSVEDPSGSLKSPTNIISLPCSLSDDKNVDRSSMNASRGVVDLFADLACKLVGLLLSLSEYACFLLPPDEPVACILGMRS